MTTPTFGVEDASFQAAGQEAGIYSLVDAFYQTMDQAPEAKPLRGLYPDDLSLAKEKLATFLIGWLGGPRRYQERFGSISIPTFHTKWEIDQELARSWMDCMAVAIAQQSYSNEFKSYLLAQLEVPTQRILQACANTQHLRCPIKKLQQP